MGPLLDKIQGNGSDSTETVNEMSEQIQEIVGEMIVTIPIDYAKERDRIVEEMKKANPKPYEDLLYSDYPEKNGREVNKRARETVTSEEAKSRLTDQVKEQLKPTITEKTKNMNTIVRAAVRKAIDKAVEKAVEKAVDGVLEQLKQQENENVSKDALEEPQQNTSE